MSALLIVGVAYLGCVLAIVALSFCSIETEPAPECAACGAPPSVCLDLVVAREEPLELELHLCDSCIDDDQVWSRIAAGELDKKGTMR